MKLFFVCAVDECGGNQDLLVEATSAVVARSLWHKYFEHNTCYETRADWPTPKYVGEVKLTGKMGAIAWDYIIPPEYEPEVM